MSNRDLAITLCDTLAAHPLHPTIDCVEIATRFLDQVGDGFCEYILPSPAAQQEFRVRQRGSWHPFVYHAVFVLTNEVYDPYWLAHPVSQHQYLDDLQAANPHVDLVWQPDLPPGYIR